jgi:GNAT superfamily N-acetyltransferase
MRIEIRGLSEDNVDDALSVCASDKLQAVPSYKEGLNVRREWLLQLYRTVGPCCKIAYMENEPVGMIQYTPLHQIPYFPTKRKDVLYIHCIFVKRNFRGKEIGSKLLHALIDEMKKPNPLFEAQPCNVLVTTARERYAFKQPSYFLSKGFTRTDNNIEVSLAYWLFETKQKEKLDIPVSGPVKVSEQGVRIFYSPFCQYYARTRTESIRKFVEKTKPNTRVEEVNLWTQPEEAIRRRVTCPVVYVNGIPVPPLDPDKFWETIKRCLSHT